MQRAAKLMVWCGIWSNKIVGPVSFGTNLNAEMYLNMPQDAIMPSLLNECAYCPAHLQQDRALPQYRTCVRRWLDQRFLCSWIVRRGPVGCRQSSADLSPLDFYLREHLKAMMYQEKIRNINYLMERITPDVLTRVHREWESASLYVFKVMATI
jgi:hypothetical protein